MRVWEMHKHPNAVKKNFLTNDFALIIAFILPDEKTIPAFMFFENLQPIWSKQIENRSSSL